MRSFTCVLIAVVLAGCASSPPTKTTTAAAPVATIGPVVPAPGATQVAMTASNNAEAPKKATVPPGYRAVERDGETLFCTKVATLGTKFKQEFCFTQEQYDETQRRGESVRQDLRKTTSMCGGGTGPFSCSGG